MTKMTITEALAEIKLIHSKLEKKRTRILENLIFIKNKADPLESEGGTLNFMHSEVQSIAALEENICAYRAAIMSANLLHTAEILGKTKSIYEWLVWKREVVDKMKIFYQTIYMKTKEKVDHAKLTPYVINKLDVNTPPELADVVPSLNYMEFSKKHEHICDILSKLDGILSLKNATIVIEVNV
jgi:hypothetical protein